MMQIERARQLKRGDSVRCPADRGSPEKDGIVVYVGTDEWQTITGAKYIWVGVRVFGHTETWPSNRLGVK